MFKLFYDKYDKAELELSIVSQLKDLPENSLNLSMEIVGCDIMSVYNPNQETTKLSLTFKSMINDEKSNVNFFTKVYIIEANGSISPMDKLGLAIYTALKNYEK